MTEKNPFEGMEEELDETLKQQLDLIKELDEMDSEVTSWEADFLQTALVQLQKAKRPMSQTQIEIVRRMCDQYDVSCDL